MKNFSTDGFDFAPRRPGVCFIFGLGNSKSSSNVENTTTTFTENTAVDSRIAATDQAVVVGDNGQFRVTTNSRSDSVTVGDGNYVGPGGTLNLLDGGAIKMAEDAARIAADAARVSAEASARAAKETTDALRGGFQSSLAAVGDVTADAFKYGAELADTSFGFGDRALTAITNVVKDAQTRSGEVVNTALSSMLDANKSEEERAFSNITTMVKWIAVAAALAVVGYAAARAK